MKEISKIQSTYICPNCSAIAEWNAYYGRFTCTRCTYEWKPDEKEQRGLTYDIQLLDSNT